MKGIMKIQLNTFKNQSKKDIEEASLEVEKALSRGLNSLKGEVQKHKKSILDLTAESTLAENNIGSFQTKF
jgi:hypothetical protein